MNEMQQEGIYRAYALSQQGHGKVRDWQAEKSRDSGAGRTQREPL